MKSATLCLGIFTLLAVATRASITSVNETNLGGDAAAIIATNFAEDVDAYSDRSHEHNGAAFNGSTLSTSGGTIVPLPGYLLGGDYVLFANNARDNAGYSAVVTTDVSSNFYLLIDNRVDGPGGNAGSPNTTDPVLGGTLQWVIMNGWTRVNTGISPGGQADFTGVDEGGNGNGAGQGLNQFYSVYEITAATSATVGSNGVGGSNMVAVVAVPAAGGGPDSDNDGLPDDWEMDNFGDLDETDSGDFDVDGLTNLQEFNIGADPKVADTDADGLDDGAEFNIHNTDPTDNDSDDDGLLDGAEVDSHSTDPNDSDSDDDTLGDFAEINTHTTDPNLADTDMDGFDDGLEVSAGSDPKDSDSVPDFSDLDDVLINEFMASNRSTLLDSDGEASDWIELWNPGSPAVDITGWHLSDDPLNLAKWTFPAHVMAPNDFLVVFASGKDRAVAGAEFHTDFQLDKAGGSFLALSRPNGLGGTEIVTIFNPYGRQYEDVSFGFFGDTPPLASGYFQTPTPGAPNDQTAVAGFVDDTRFSIDRGFYDSPIAVDITSPTPGAAIIYTTDGTVPTESPLNGTRVNAPDADTGPTASVNITTTTNLRALAVKSGFEPTNVDTHTYIFRAAVLQQSNSNVPPHVNWGHAGPDYEMDPDVVNHADPQVRPTAEDFLRVPTVSLTMDWNLMFGSGGIYISGEGVDRPTSIEYINPGADTSDPNTLKGFQVDGTVRIVGGSSTGRWKSDKLSMRLKFSPDLRYPVFGDGRSDRFDTLVLDHRLNNVWHYNPGSGAGPGQAARAQYTHDQFPADLHNLMGGLSPEGKHCLIYINGVLWGVTELHERPDDNFAAEYLGGDNGEYDVIKHQANRVVAGSSTAYNAMLNLTRRDMGDQTNFDAVEEVLHIDNFIAYMIANYYVGNTDWAHQNWYASYGRDRPDGKWYYHSWDPEHCMESTTQNVTNKDNAGGPTEVFVNLVANPEFRLRFADAVHRHFHNDGVLTPENAATAYRRRADAVDFVTRIESARWGDNGDTRIDNPYTRLDWLRVRDQMLGTVGGGAWGNYFPARTGIVLQQFVSRGWYPQTDAPEMSPFGGSLPNNATLTLTSPDGGAIYYTDDGSDPRTPASGEEVVEHSLVAPGSPRRGIQPSDNSVQNTWFTEAFDDSSWPTGTLGAGFDSGKYNPLIDPAFDMAGSVDSSAYETFYLRWKFDVADPAIFNSLSLGARFDDGYVAYLNGTEIARVNNTQAVGVPLAFDGRATSNQSDEDSAQTFAPNDVSQHLGLLKAGTNVLAVHGLNGSIGSSDMLIDATLDAAEGIGGDAGGLSPSAKLYTGPFTLTDSAQIRARVFAGGEWSALTEASFIIGTVPADASNLAVTEINYRPGSPTPTELAAGHNDRSDFEFIELANISSTEKIELTGVIFVSGISFNFSEHSSIMELAPGESLLIVEDLEAFEFRYGAGLPVAGIFQNGSQLSNGGEEISISNLSLAPPDQLLRAFTYDDSAPWPTSPDGEGFSLTLIDPSSNPDHALPENWRASVAPDGSPGGSDATTFASWAAGYGAGLTELGDDDDDRLVNLIEYGLATSPLTPSAHSAPASAMSADDQVMTFRANKAADDLVIEPEASADLETWVAAEVISRVDNGDGTETVTARAPQVASPAHRSFLRLRITLKR